MTVQLTDQFCGDSGPSEVRATDQRWLEAVAALGFGRDAVAPMTVAAARGRLVSTVLDLLAAQDADAYDQHAQHVADAARTLTHALAATALELTASSSR